MIAIDSNYLMDLARAKSHEHRNVLAQTQLRPRLVSRILFDPGGEGLAIACKFIGLDKPSFASLFTISRNARAKQAAANKQDLRKVLNFYDRTTASAATKVVRHWRRDENYLSAIADIELSP
ncbi:MAG: DUF2336 domain-containing protein [Alphaproteobacteria bacterium]|jgi:hypothetical protein|nr:DUF2336 domain-containing protein [Alphaproteobacteria bacterium]|tara:strand:- start:561 stop:926 length:366 start_codon:yes stop_codon:yes gene_type:complete